MQEGMSSPEEDSSEMWDNMDIPVTGIQELMLNSYHYAPASGGLVINSFILNTLEDHSIEKTLNELVKNYPILRTSYKKVGGKYVGHVIPYDQSLIDYFILSESNNNNYALFANKILTAFPLHAGVPLRVGVLPIGNRFLVVTGAHHIIGDSASMLVLATAMKNYLIDGRSINRSSWKLDFSFCTKKMDIRKNENLIKNVAWQKENIYKNFTVRKNLNFLKSSKLKFFTEEEFEVIKKTSHALRVTKFVLFTCLFNLFIKEFSSEKKDLVIGTPFVSRQINDDTISPQMDYHLFCCPLSLNSSFEENIQLAKQAIRGSKAHYAPLRDIVAEMPLLYNKKAALFDYLIVYCPFFFRKESLSLFVSDPEVTDCRQCIFLPYEGQKASIVVMEHETKIAIQIEADAMKYSEEDMDKMSFQFLHFVREKISSYR